MAALVDSISPNASLQRKPCTVCHQDKPKTDFSKNQWKKGGGRDRICYDCNPNPNAGPSRKPCTRKPCKDCGTAKPMTDYSNNQWKKKVGSGTCLDCQRAAGHPNVKSASLPTASVVAPASLAAPEVLSGVPPSEHIRVLLRHQKATTQWITRALEEFCDKNKDYPDSLNDCISLEPIGGDVTLGDQHLYDTTSIKTWVEGNPSDPQPRERLTPRDLRCVKTDVFKDLKKSVDDSNMMREKFITSILKLDDLNTKLRHEFENLKSNSQSAGGGDGGGGESKQSKSDPVRSEADEMLIARLQKDLDQVREKAGLREGCSVEWTNGITYFRNDDIPVGTSGFIKYFRNDDDDNGEARAAVEFPTGSWLLRLSELRKTASSELGSSWAVDSKYHLVEAARNMFPLGFDCKVMMKSPPTVNRSVPSTKRACIHSGKIIRTKVGEQNVELEMFGPSGKFRHTITCTDLHQKIVEAEAGFASGEKVRICHDKKKFRDGQVVRVVQTFDGGCRVYVKFADDQKSREFGFAPRGLRALIAKLLPEYYFRPGDVVEHLYVKNPGSYYHASRLVRFGTVIKVIPGEPGTKWKSTQVTVQFGGGTPDAVYCAMDLYWMCYKAQTGFDSGDEVLFHDEGRLLKGTTSMGKPDEIPKIKVNFAEGRGVKEYYPSDLWRLLHTPYSQHYATDGGKRVLLRQQ